MKLKATKFKATKFKATKFEVTKFKAKQSKAYLNNGLRPRTNATKVRWIAVAMCGLVTCFSGQMWAQISLPFEVSNPKHLTWSVEEAGRIYASACQLVARSVRPEKPPELQPRFVLILGAKADQMIRDGRNAEIHLRKWDPARFAEAMVLLTLREAVRAEDVTQLARETLNAAESTITVNELKQKK